MAKMTVEQQRDELLRTLKKLETALHNGDTAETDGYAVQDVRELAENIVTILETVKGMTQPDMLLALDNGVKVYKSLDTHNIPEYSVWKAMKELRTPEMKKGMGFMITFLKNLSKEENN